VSAPKRKSSKKAATPAAEPAVMVPAWRAFCSDNPLDELGWIYDDLTVVRLALAAAENELHHERIDSALYRIGERVEMVNRELLSRAVASKAVTS
jgi:hypothetical protein